ncbi:SurA N-terminal domain-containing protein [Aliiroseovarius sp. M344]|uniref:SurA N-terminal domain-containing protein n=1 Tax=Aliiroseovarius sp. M344 TaxID=2867010 RepID=UPI0021ADFD21|nr:SurA N-terminal domain-containing protein [Aliiroseovarius sp. M344]UWQ15602.1 SurA N-terminal domain-containing protein [Aliiroseovarius sp. M344]
MATGKTSRTFGWILMGLVMVGLVGFGSTNFGGSVRSVATVGETEVDANRYLRELQSEMNAFQAETGQRLTMEMARGIGLDQQVLARVIATAALEDETARLGISVGDEELRKRIVDIPAFKGVDGKFDRDGYTFALEQSGLTASEFEKSLRDEVSRQILQAAVANGVSTQPSYVDTLFGYARETRDFTWATMSVDRLSTPVPAPTDDALTTYYEAHPQDFTLPEIKVISYAWLNPEDVIPTITISDEQIRALYDERASEYLVPERRMVERLVFNTADDAQAAADAIAAGEKTFEELVADRNLQLSDIDLGDLPRDELGAAGDAVFDLEEPGVTGPHDSDLGPALFRMNAILAARDTSFDDAREELHGELAADAARRLISDMVAELDDQMAGGATIEEVAKSHNMQLGTLNWTAGDSEGIAAYDAFREVAEVVTTDDFPEITLLEDGGVFALRLDELQAPRLQEQAEVADAVRAGWDAEKRLDLLAEEARALIPQLENGESLSSLGLTEVIEQDQTREAFVEGTPPNFMREVFGMEPGSWRVLESSDNVVLVRLDAIQPAEQDSDDAKTLKANFATGTAQEIALDVENAFARAVQNRAGIELNRAVINAVNAQLQ